MVFAESGRQSKVSNGSDRHSVVSKKSDRQSVVSAESGRQTVEFLPNLFQVLVSVLNVFYT